MAYTIISQNNTTTTLQDENGNIIYVPGRVTLATSTDYTITEVNNNTATLTDGSGKVIRDVPCVVVLAGGGGSDPHNLGFYADLTALQTAHPTGADGDFAILGSTDTVWIWDTDTSAWVDSDQKGQVTSVNGQTGAVVIPDELPSQTGHSGEFLTTDGTDASWAAVNALKNTATGTDSLTVLGTAATSSYSTNVGVGSMASNQGTALGFDARATDSNSVAVGIYARATKMNTVGIRGSATGANAIAIGGTASATQAYQFGDGTNSEANTVKFRISSENYKLLDSDGTIPTDRLVHAINKYSSMPTAASTNEGWIVQFTGTTDSTYTHGHLYECVSDGQTPATYSWTEVQLGGGSSLPSQTGNAGKFLMTDGTDASWSDKPLVNTATGSNALTVAGNATIRNGSVNVGVGSKADGNQGVAIGGSAQSSDDSIAIGYGTKTNNAIGATAIGSGAQAAGRSVALGYQAKATAAYCMQINLGLNSNTNSVANTVKIANGNGNYEMMSADGTIPHARLTNAVQSASVTIATTDWSSNTASVTVSGLTATSVVWVAPDNASQSAYTTSGVHASSQSADTLVFSCTQTPASSLTINVVWC